MPEFISPARPLIAREKRVAVDRLLRHGMLSQGSEVAAFEQEFASHFGLDRPCVAVNSGSYQLLRLIVQERKSPCHVVCFIDDAKGRRNLRMLGVPVLGGEQRLLEIAGYLTDRVVLVTGAGGSIGEVLVLDMGQPVSIWDVAKRLIARSGRRIDIIFTGLRPGGKMHGVLFSADLHGRRWSHPLISLVNVPPLDPELLAVLSNGTVPAVSQEQAGWQQMLEAYAVEEVWAR